MAICAADAGNYPWVKSAARSIRSPRRMGRPLERKAGRLCFIDKARRGRSRNDGLAWGCKASMFVITFFNLLSRLLPTFFQRQCAMGKKEGR